MDIDVNSSMENIMSRLRSYTRKLREEQLNRDLERVWCIFEKHLPEKDLRELYNVFKEKAEAHIEERAEREVEQEFWLAVKKQIEKDVFKEHKGV